MNLPPKSNRSSAVLTLYKRCNDAHSPLCVSPGHKCSVLHIINKVAPYADRGEPGAWNDLDMLEVGMGGMTDDEYKAHFTMWAILKSPLLIGADIRHLSPRALTILNNPAIIAINQDPLGRGAHRLRLNTNVKKDKYGVGEAHVWAGALANGDQVVAFLNAAAEDLEMEIELDEIFVLDGPGGSAPQAKQSWTVHDLWGHRMSENVAKKIIDGSKTGGSAEDLLRQVSWYNSSELSYRDGLELEDARLLGKEIGMVSPGGSLRAIVPRHGTAIFRLRSTEKGAKRYATHKDEL